MSCLCACDSSSDKAALITFLRQEQHEIGLIATSELMWNAGKEGLAVNGLNSLTTSDNSAADANTQNPSYPTSVSQSVQGGTQLSNSPVDQQASYSAPNVAPQAQIVMQPSQPRRRVARSRPQVIAAPQQQPQQQPQLASQQQQPDVNAEASQSPAEAAQQPSQQAAYRRKMHQQNIERAKKMKSLAYKAFLNQAKIKSPVRRPPPGDESALTDMEGFNWNQMRQQPPGRKDPAMIALEKESNKIDDVYDPSEDPQNIGPPALKPKTHTNWWNDDTMDGAKLDDQWWQHGGEPGMTG